MNPFKALWADMLDQRDRWILWTPVPLAAGVGAYFSLHAEPPPMLGAGLLAALALAILPFYRNRVVTGIWAVLVLAALGFTAAQWRVARLDMPVLHKKTWPAPTIRGRIVEVDPLEKAWRITMDDLAFSDSIQPRMPARVRIRMKSNDPATPRAGDVVEVRASLLPLPKPVAPEAFDFQRYAYFRGLGATGYAISDIRVVAPGETDYFFENLREAIRVRVDNAGVADRRTGALMKAFLIGDDNAISQADWDTARDSGIAHLIAISGSHFVMIVGVFFFAVRALLAAFPYVALRWPVKKIAAGAGMAAAVFYMLLIGAPIPAQRAAVMSCVVLLAVMLDRDPFTLRIAALAAMIVLLLEPESLVGASFQLSFAAVVGLIAFFESRRETWLRWRQGEGFWHMAGLVLAAGLLTTFVASLATAPFALYHFLRVPFVGGLVANLVAVPMSSFITFPAGLLACLLMPLGLEQGALWIMARSVEAIMATAETVASWPRMMIGVDAWPAHWLAVIALGGLWLCLWRSRIRWAGLAPVILALAMIPRAERADILVGDGFKFMVAVRDDAGILWFPPGRRDRFVRDIWAEREGGQGTARWEEGMGADFMPCDARACVYEARGMRVVFVKQKDRVLTTPEEEGGRKSFADNPDFDRAAVARDCETADIVILPMAEAPDACRNAKARVIDKWNLYHAGPHAVYAGKNGPRVVSVRDVRGIRPWTGERVRKERKKERKEDRRVGR